MRQQITPEALLRDMPNFISPQRIAESLRAGLSADLFDLEMNRLINNQAKCKELSDRICDTEILLCFLELRYLS